MFIQLKDTSVTTDNLIIVQYTKIFSNTIKRFLLSKIYLNCLHRNNFWANSVDIHDNDFHSCHIACSIPLQLYIE